MSQRHFYTIDIARFLAATLVAVYHLNFKAFANPTEQLYPLASAQLAREEPFPLAAQGWIGVQVFFVVSGFVIAMSIRDLPLKAYLRQRLLRLVPAVWLITPVCAAVSLLYFHDPASDVARGAIRTLLFAPLPPWLLGQFWTLPVELAFYCVIALMMVGGARRHLEPLAWALGLVSLGFWLAAAPLGYSGRFQSILQLLLIQHGMYFGVGIIAFRIFQSGLNFSRALYFLFASIAAWLQIDYAAQWEAVGLDRSEAAAVAFAVWIAFALLILAAAAYRGRPILKSDTLGEAIKLLGASTYPLYLLHYHVGGTALIAMRAMGAGRSVSSLVALAISIGAAMLIAHYVEPWLRRHLARLGQP